MTQERRFLRPATFAPAELALIYEALMAVSVPSHRVRVCASALDKLEAASEVVAPAAPNGTGDYDAKPGRLAPEDKATFDAAVKGATGRDAPAEDEGAPV